MNFEGLRFTVEHGGERVQLTSPLVGKFNAYNILAACGAALSYGLDWKTITRAIANSPARAPAALRAFSKASRF
jgi:UDP-N-acetylmuramoyl-L-alanyl-D-glutamate--2,6-diaminopimelate ligase